MLERNVVRVNVFLRIHSLALACLEGVFDDRWRLNFGPDYDISARILRYHVALGDQVQHNTALACEYSALDRNREHLDPTQFYPGALLFSKDLRLGETDPDVQRLQAALNKNPATQVAKSGPGSPGEETEYFGILTIAAVKKYQALHNIPETGFVGPLTRAALSA